MIRFDEVIVGHKLPLTAKLNTFLEEGSRTLLLGKNGVGKTTLLKSMIGLTNLLDGTISLNVDSKNPYSYLASSGNRVGFMDGQEYLMLGLGDNISGKIEEIVAVFNLLDILYEPITKLSDGQFQKLRIAKTFLQTKPITLLDEPLSFLDPIQIKSVISSIENWTRAYPTTLLLTTHQFAPFIEFDYDYLYLDYEFKKGKVRDFNMEMFGE